MTIGTDVSSAFQAGSGLAAPEIRVAVASLAVVAVLLFAAWYLIKVFARGWKKADLPHVMTGVVLVLVLIFFVMWFAAQDW